MKNLMYLAALALVVTTSTSRADDVITGVIAKRLWARLPGPIAGPFCAGVCPPAPRACDPPCFYTKSGNGWQCSRTEYRESRPVEYHCIKSR